MKAKRYELSFIKKLKKAKDVYSFHFQKPINLKFNPGQYFKINLTIDNPDDRGTSRYFTISSSPNEQDLVITTKIFNSSFKNKLHSLKKGEKVNFFGPIGYFDVNFNNKIKKVFLAGGIGITPFRSILKSLENSNSDVILISSHSKKEDLIFEEELKLLEKSNKNLNVHFTITQEKINSYHNERISRSLIEKLIPDYLNAEYFIVGTIAMEEELLNLIVEMGVDRERIFTENFTGY